MGRGIRARRNQIDNAVGEIVGRRAADVTPGALMALDVCQGAEPVVCQLKELIGVGHRDVSCPALRDDSASTMAGIRKGLLDGPPNYVASLTWLA